MLCRPFFLELPAWRCAAPALILSSCFSDCRMVVAVLPDASAVASLSSAAAIAAEEACVESVSLAESGLASLNFSATAISPPSGYCQEAKAHMRAVFRVPPVAADSLNMRQVILRQLAKQGAPGTTARGGICSSGMCSGRFSRRISARSEMALMALEGASGSVNALAAPLLDSSWALPCSLLQVIGPPKLLHAYQRRRSWRWTEHRGM